MTVYLVDEAFCDIAFSYASTDGNARIVLLEDAVYFALKGRLGRETYALVDDVNRRGLNSKVPSSLHLLTYDDLVQMMEKENVVNFL